jgi:hypothetical protein
MRKVVCFRVVQGSYPDTYRVTPSAYPTVVRTHEEGGNTRPVFAALASSVNLSSLPQEPNSCHPDLQQILLPFHEPPNHYCV